MYDKIIIMFVSMGWCVEERALEHKTATNTNKSNSIKMMQESLISNYNTLLSFRHEEVVI